MAIPTAWAADPTAILNGNVKMVDIKTGLPTQEFLQAYDALRTRNNAGNRVIPCSAVSAANVITLTPNDAAPLIKAYRDYEIFVFVADATSTGNVAATVVPKTGTLPTLKVFKSDGAAQAAAGDIVAGSLYLFVVADAFDTGNGGFILK